MHILYAWLNLSWSYFSFFTNKQSITSSTSHCLIIYYDHILWSACSLSRKYMLSISWFSWEHHWSLRICLRHWYPDFPLTGIRFREIACRYPPQRHVRDNLSKWPRSQSSLTIACTPGYVPCNRFGIIKNRVAWQIAVFAYVRICYSNYFTQNVITGALNIF